jgi:hypothetical protein
MEPFGMTAEEKAKILQQHRDLEKQNQEKKEALKQGLQKPQEKNPK